MTEQAFRPGGLVLPVQPVSALVPEGEPFLTPDQAPAWLESQGLSMDRLRAFREDGVTRPPEDSDDL